MNSVFKALYPVMVISYLLSNCGDINNSNSGVSSGPTVSSIAYMALSGEDAGQGIDLYISVPSSIAAVGVCTSANADQACAANSGDYEASVLAHRRSDRTLFKLPRKFQPDLSKVYKVINTDSGALLLKARLTDGSTAVGLEQGLSLINENTLREEVNYISSNEFKGRLAGTADHERASDWIIEQVKKINIQPARGDNYKQTFTITNGPASGRKSANIVAVLPGQDEKLKNEYIILGAHLDHVGTLYQGHGCGQGAGASNAICNGADDNASGTIALLNTAKALAAVRQSLKRTVVLIWFSAEEVGLLGSKYYVTQDPIFPLKNTAYMINLDMLGYMKNNQNKLLALAGTTSPEAVSFLKKIGSNYSERGIVISKNTYQNTADHGWFLAKNIPAVFFTTGLHNNHHKTSDSSEKIDFLGMSMSTRVVAELSWNMANADSLSKGLALREDTEITEEQIEMMSKYSCHEGIGNPLDKDDFRGFVFE